MYDTGHAMKPVSCSWFLETHFRLSRSTTTVLSSRDFRNFHKYDCKLLWHHTAPRKLTCYETENIWKMTSRTFF